MATLMTCGLVIAATLFGGILAGGNIDGALVQGRVSFMLRPIYKDDNAMTINITDTIVREMLVRAAWPLPDPIPTPPDPLPEPPPTDPLPPVPDPLPEPVPPPLSPEPQPPMPQMKQMGRSRESIIVEQIKNFEPGWDGSLHKCASRVNGGHVTCRHGH